MGADHPSLRDEHTDVRSGACAGSIKLLREAGRSGGPRPGKDLRT